MILQHFPYAQNLELLLDGLKGEPQFASAPVKGYAGQAPQQT